MQLLNKGAISIIKAAHSMCCTIADIGRVWTDYSEKQWGGRGRAGVVRVSTCVFGTVTKRGNDNAGCGGLLISMQVFAFFFLKRLRFQLRGAFIWALIIIFIHMVFIYINVPRSSQSDKQNL